MEIAAVVVDYGFGCYKNRHRKINRFALFGIGIYVSITFYVPKTIALIKTTNKY